MNSNVDERFRTILQSQKKRDNFDSDDLEFITQFIQQFPKLVDYTKNQLECSHSYLRDIAKHLQYKELKPGEILVQQGDKYSGYYLILSGKLECFQKKLTEQIEQEIKEYNEKTQSVNSSFKQVLQAKQNRRNHVHLLSQHSECFSPNKEICTYQNLNLSISRFNCIGEVLSENPTSPHLVVASEFSEIAFISQSICCKLFATQISQIHFLEISLSRIFSSSFKKEDITQMAKTFKEKVVKGVLFSKGEEAKDIFIIRRGVITLQIEDCKILDIGQGGLFGHEDALSESKRTLNAYTQCNSLCTVLYSSILELSSGSPVELMRSLIRKGKKKQIKYHNMYQLIKDNQKIKEEQSNIETQQSLSKQFLCLPYQKMQGLSSIIASSKYSRSCSAYSRSNQRNASPIQSQVARDPSPLQNSRKLSRDKNSQSPYFLANRNGQISSQPNQWDTIKQQASSLQKVLDMSSKKLSLSSINKDSSRKSSLIAEYAHLDSNKISNKMIDNSKGNTPTASGIVSHQQQTNTPFTSAISQVCTPIPQPAAWKALQISGYQNSPRSNFNQFYRCNSSLKQKDQYKTPLKQRSTLTSYVKQGSKNDMSTSLQDIQQIDHQSKKVAQNEQTSFPTIPNETNQLESDINCSSSVKNDAVIPISEKNPFQMDQRELGQELNQSLSSLSQILNLKKEEEEEFDLRSKYVPVSKPKKKIPLLAPQEILTEREQKTLRNNYYELIQPNTQVPQMKGNSQSVLNQLFNQNVTNLISSQQILNQQKVQSNIQDQNLVLKLNLEGSLQSPSVYQQPHNFLQLFPLEEEVHSSQSNSKYMSPRSTPLFANSVLSIHLKANGNNLFNMKNQQNKCSSLKEGEVLVSGREKISSQDVSTLDAMCYAKKTVQPSSLIRQKILGEKSNSLHFINDEEKPQLSKKIQESNKKVEGSQTLSIIGNIPASSYLSREQQQDDKIAKKSCLIIGKSSLLYSKPCLLPLNYMAPQGSKIKLRIPNKAQQQRMQNNKNPQ